MEEWDCEYKAFIAALQGYIDKNSIEDVAENYPCSSSYIYQILNGQKVAGRKTQGKIARACGYEAVFDFSKEEELKKEESLSYSDLIDQIVSLKKMLAQTTDGKLLNYSNLKNSQHHNIIDEFQQPKLVEEINQLMLEIEKIKKIRLKKIKVILEAELEELIEERQSQASKKRTATGAE